MKNADVTSCGHSNGWPTTLAATSRSVVDVKPTRHTPQSRISARSSGSSARHFRWRSAAWTRSARSSIAYSIERQTCRIFSACGPRPLASFSCSGSAILMKLALSTPDDLDAELLQPVERLVLERDRL